MKLARSSSSFSGKMGFQDKKLRLFLPCCRREVWFSGWECWVPCLVWELNLASEFANITVGFWWLSLHLRTSTALPCALPYADLFNIPVLCAFLAKKTFLELLHGQKKEKKRLFSCCLFAYWTGINAKRKITFFYYYFLLFCLFLKSMFVCW